MVVSNILYFHPYLGKIPFLTNIFQMGWNHQLDSLHWGSWFGIGSVEGFSGVAKVKLSPGRSIGFFFQEVKPSFLKNRTCFSPLKKGGAIFVEFWSKPKKMVVLSRKKPSKCKQRDIFTGSLFPQLPQREKTNVVPSCQVWTVKR